MILEVLWDTFACIETSLQFGMCDVAGYNDGALEVHTCRNWVLGKFSTYSIDALVKVDFDTLAAFSWVAEFLGDKF